jgi:phosphohistidine phosphatase
MKLYLVRHGKAGDAFRDEDRELTASGIQDCTRFFTWINDHIPLESSRLLHSGLVRARQTADLLATSMTLKPSLEMAADLTPNADPRIWMRILSKEIDNIVLVGHNPHLSRLVSMLVSGQEDDIVVEMKKGMIVCLERESYSGWSIDLCLAPKLVK